MANAGARRMAPSMIPWLLELEQTRVKGLLPKEVVIGNLIELKQEEKIGTKWCEITSIELPAGTRIDLWMNYDPKNGGGCNSKFRVTVHFPDRSKMTIASKTYLIRQQSAPRNSGVLGKSWRG